jgi:transcriptional regulator NrdR family protein
MIDTCPSCGELLYPGTAKRVVERGRAADIVTCPWCGAEQRWSALERVGMEGRAVRVRYECRECRRPFTVEHDPTEPAEAAATDLTEQERAWLRFMRDLVRRGRVEP